MWYIIYSRIIALKRIVDIFIQVFGRADAFDSIFRLCRKWDISAKSTREYQYIPHLSSRYYREWNTVIPAMQYIRGPALRSPISTENRLNIASCDRRGTLHHRDASGALRRDAKPRNKHARTTFPRVYQQ